MERSTRSCTRWNFCVWVFFSRQFAMPNAAMCWQGKIYTWWLHRDKTKQQTRTKHVKETGRGWCKTRNITTMQTWCEHRRKQETFDKRSGKTYDICFMPRFQYRFSQDVAGFKTGLKELAGRFHLLSDVHKSQPDGLDRFFCDRNEIGGLGTPCPTGSFLEN